MAYTRTYQYETSPRKLKPEYERIKRTYPKKTTARRISREQEAKRLKVLYRKIIMYVVIGFLGLFIISYRYSLIDDTHKALKKEEENLAMIKKETTQLEANIESSLNLKRIEEEARNQLGMKEIAAEQKVYVSLPKTDHIETSLDAIKTSETKENWFMELINKIAKNFR